jgi:hypothetical protein
LIRGGDNQFLLLLRLDRRQNFAPTQGSDGRRGYPTRLSRISHVESGKMLRISVPVSPGLPSDAAPVAFSQWSCFPDHRFGGTIYLMTFARGPNGVSSIKADGRCASSELSDDHDHDQTNDGYNKIVPKHRQQSAAGM